MKQLAVDLVILNERPRPTPRICRPRLEALVRASQSRGRPRGGGRARSVFVLRADLVSVEVRSLLQTAARAVLLSRRGSLAEQVKRLEESEPPPAARRAARRASPR